MSGIKNVLSASQRGRIRVMTAVRTSGGTSAAGVNVQYGRWSFSRNFLLPISHSHVTEFLDDLVEFPAMERGDLRALLMNLNADGIPHMRLPSSHGLDPDCSQVVAPAPLSRHVARILSNASDRLPPDLRQRFATDWATDALWIEGRFARLRFVLGVRLLAVPRLLREHELPRKA